LEQARMALIGIDQLAVYTIPDTVLYQTYQSKKNIVVEGIQIVQSTPEDMGQVEEDQRKDRNFTAIILVRKKRLVHFGESLCGMVATTVTDRALAEPRRSEPRRGHTAGTATSTPSECISGEQWQSSHRNRTKGTRHSERE